MARWMVSAGLAFWTAVQAAPGAAKPVVLGVAWEYPHAGIALAAPVGFQPRSLSAPYDVMHAVAVEDGRPVQAVTLSAFPAAEKVTADEFAELKMAELSRNLAIRNLKPLKKTTMPIAGTTGSARLMSYTFRGAKALAAQVYVLREVQGAKLRICYLLTVVCSATRQARLLPTLGAVVRSVRLLSVRHPVLSDEVKLGEPVEDYSLGYSLRRPVGWYAAKSPAGLEMGQVDYLLGGVPLPSAQLLCGRVPGDTATSEVCAKTYISEAKREALHRKQTCTVVSEGPATLGGLNAYQFVILQGPDRAGVAPRSKKDAQNEAVVMVQRTACLPAGPAGKPRVFALVLTGRGKDIKPAEALMKTLAASFRHVQPTTQPTTQPSTRPTTKPAG